MKVILIYCIYSVLFDCGIKLLAEIIVRGAEGIGIVDGAVGIDDHKTRNTAYAVGIGQRLMVVAGSAELRP